MFYSPKPRILVDPGADGGGKGKSKQAGKNGVKKSFLAAKYEFQYIGIGLFSTVMQTLVFVSGLHNCLEFSQPLSSLYQAMSNTESVFGRLLKQFSKLI